MTLSNFFPLVNINNMPYQLRNDRAKVQDAMNDMSMTSFFGVHLDSEKYSIQETKG